MLGGDGVTKARDAQKGCEEEEDLKIVSEEHEDRCEVEIFKDIKIFRIINLKEGKYVFINYIRV